jgi:phage-related protein
VARRFTQEFASVSAAGSARHGRGFVCRSTRPKTAEHVKPFKGVGSGVMEIAERYATNAYRLIYAVQLGKSIYVLHVFQKKSKSGIATPKMDVDLIVKRYKEARERAKNE